MCLGRGEGFGKVTPGQGGGWLEGVGGFKGTSGRGQEKFVFSPKNRPQGENECVQRLPRKRKRSGKAVQVGQAG